MSKNKFGSYQINQTFSFNGQEVTIIDKFKGNKTNKVNKQYNIITGFKSNPCLYKLSNGLIVKGSTIKRHLINKNNLI